MASPPDRFRTQFRMTVYGDETAWVAGVNGTAPFVQLALEHLLLVGTLSDLRDRLTALVGLLDDLEQQPERWWEVSAWEKVGPKHHRRVTPNPFIRRPNPPKVS